MNDQIKFGKRHIQYVQVKIMIVHFVYHTCYVIMFSSRKNDRVKLLPYQHINVIKRQFVFYIFASLVLASLHFTIRDFPSYLSCICAKCFCYKFICNYVFCASAVVGLCYDYHDNASVSLNEK